MHLHSLHLSPNPNAEEASLLIHYIWSNSESNIRPPAVCRLVALFVSSHTCSSCSSNFPRCQSPFTINLLPTHCGLLRCSNLHFLDRDLFFSFCCPTEDRNITANCRRRVGVPKMCNFLFDGTRNFANNILAIATTPPNKSRHRFIRLSPDDAPNRDELFK